MEPVAGQNGVCKRKALYRGLPAPPERGMVDHIVVHQGRGVQVLKRRGERVQGAVVPAAGPGADDAQHGTNSLASAEERIVQHFLQQGVRGSQVFLQFGLHGLFHLCRNGLQGGFEWRLVCIHSDCSVEKKAATRARSWVRGLGGRLATNWRP